MTAIKALVLLFMEGFSVKARLEMMDEKIGHRAGVLIFPRWNLRVRT
jgi:hypothetical protein